MYFLKELTQGDFNINKRILNYCPFLHWMYDIIHFNVREQLDDLTTKKGQQLQTHREISDKHFLIINWKF